MEPTAGPNTGCCGEGNACKDVLMETLGRNLQDTAQSCQVKSTERPLVYLDHAGTTLPPKELLEIVTQDMLTSVYANPHSHSALGSRTEELIHKARGHVYQLLHVSPHQYDVVFTSGATAACKLVAESFPFGESGVFSYPMNAHTSVLGMRAYANNAVVFPSSSQRRHEAAVDSTCLNVGVDEPLPMSSDCNLLAVTGECNFSGMQADLQYIPALIEGLKSGKQAHEVVSASPGESSATATAVQASMRGNDWIWLLDASKLAATTEININHTLAYADRPHFICLSMYKIFGYPTGCGCLVIRRDAAQRLQKRYFGGGTVLSAAASCDFSVPQSSQPHRYMEDGTANYYAIAGKSGFVLDCVRRYLLLMVMQH
jgi:molybdenum cofactor sulfurtransferase